MTVRQADDDGTDSVFLASFVNWLDGLGPGALLQWAQANGDDALIGLVPLSVAALLE